MKNIKKIIIFLIFIILLIYILSNLKNANTNIDKPPYLLDLNCSILESDNQKGITIKDSNDNEWVWIKVPKEEVFLTAEHNRDYAKIEYDIEEYTKDYSSDDYEDNVDNVENIEYKTLKEKTLSSIYEYGGFWISRYEIGTEQVRNDKKNEITKAYSQPNKYVYNYITFSQAKELAQTMSNDEYTSSLLFGFQWDLVCKFIEENGYNIENEKITKQMINCNSSTWGNYYSSSFEINRGKYSENYGNDYYDAQEIKEKRAYKNILLTTGASERNKVCNIYDFAGNISEWTLEYQKNDKTWNVIRDGSFYFNYGGNDPVNGRYSIDTDSSGINYGFRVMCVKMN